MITTDWQFAAVLMLAAAVFPALAQRFRWRIFDVLPPIVLTYLFVTALAVAGVWGTTPAVQATQRWLALYLLPALLFLLMTSCDLRAILAVGPRVLSVFGCAMATILLAIALTYLMFRGLLPAVGWKMFAALSATWTGGSANLVAVKQITGLADDVLPAVLLADALCYSLWVLLLFSTSALLPRWNRWTRGGSHPLPTLAATLRQAATPVGMLGWLIVATFVGFGASRLAALLPASSLLTTTSWTVLIATTVGLLVAQTPFARSGGPALLSSALLALLVAVLASQSNFHGLATAPLFIACAFCTMLLHVLMLMGLARLFRFDLRLCAIASLAQIGGVGSAPVLAATYSPVLVPIAVLLALLGLVLGTGMGLLMATVLSALAPVS